MALPWGSHVLHRLLSGKREKIFLSEPTRPKALIFGMKHHLVNLYQACSNYVIGAKLSFPPGLHVSHRLI